MAKGSRPPRHSAAASLFLMPPRLPGAVARPRCSCFGLQTWRFDSQSRLLTDCLPTYPHVFVRMLGIYPRQELLVGGECECESKLVRQELVVGFTLFPARLPARRKSGQLGLDPRAPEKPLRRGTDTGCCLSRMDGTQGLRVAGCKAHHVMHGIAPVTVGPLSISFSPPGIFVR